MKRRTVRLLWAAAILLLLAELIVVYRPEKSPAPSGAAPGERMADFSVSCMDGAEFMLSAHRGKVVFVKKHTRIAQRRRNVFWIVLRERNENNAALLEYKRLALKQLVGLDAVYAVFANDALP